MNNKADIEMPDKIPDAVVEEELRHEIKQYLKEKEQIRAIREELGETEGEDLRDLEARLAKTKLTNPAREGADRASSRRGEYELPSRESAERCGRSRGFKGTPARERTGFFCSLWQLRDGLRTAAS